MTLRHASLLLAALLPTAAFCQSAPAPQQAQQPTTVADWQQLYLIESNQLTAANSQLNLANWQIQQLQQKVADLQAKLDALAPKAPAPKK